MATIGFIGVGELALYTIKGVRKGGYQGDILLSPRNAAKAAWLEQNLKCKVMADNQSVATNSDYLFIATRPADCMQTLSELEFRPDQVLVSVVAGITIAQLRAAVGNQIQIARAMPVSSAEAASSPTLIFPAQPFVTEFFDYCGQSIAVDNEAIFDQGSVLACVYCWFFTLFEELIQATQGAHLPNDIASKLVMGMARGAADLALENKTMPPGEIATAIATEGTFSKMGLDLLQKSDAFKPWADACLLLKKQLAKND
ncbi:MAG: pyrroline-5-carboxylate reductase [Gammaproteobacteria bacterium]|jgi:pyrroline-5-carboxylate reductase